MSRGRSPTVLARMWRWACLLLALGCDRPRAVAGPDLPATADGTREAARPIELLTWWGPVGQSNPTEALIAVHRSMYPRDVIVNAKTIFASEARRTTRMQLESGDPPDVFQSTIGKDHMQWVLTNGVDDRAAKIRAIDGLIDDVPSWRKVIPPWLLGKMSFAGKLYGVPATVHRVNAVFYNKDVLRQNGLAVPSSIEDLEGAGEKLRAAGIPLFAIGSREPWLAHVVFEDLLVAREGPQFYESYFRGKELVDDPRIVETLRAALRLLRYRGAELAPVDPTRLTWIEAAQQVAKGEAAATVTGDWAEVLFAPDGLGEGDAVVEAAFPGTEETLVATVDTFSIPVAAKNLEGAKRLIATIGSEQGQRILSKVKGGLSPRSDVSATLPGAMKRKKFELLREGRMVLGLSALLPPRFRDDVNWALLEMVKQDDIEPVMQTLRSRYRLLSAPADAESRPF